MLILHDLLPKTLQELLVIEGPFAQGEGNGKNKANKKNYGPSKFG